MEAVALEWLANVTTVTDSANRATKAVSNVLGQVTSVVEDPGGMGLQTLYSYDPLGNLHTVLKCSAGGCSSGQTRTFTYDSLSRLVSAVNPESGTYSYSYANASGNQLVVQSRVDARGNTTTYRYDAMDKLISVS